jgi:hypothetical protein
MGSLHLQCVALMTTRELSRVQIFESLLANVIAVYDPRYTYLVHFALLCIDLDEMYAVAWPQTIIMEDSKIKRESSLSIRTLGKVLASWLHSRDMYGVLA